jgi:hypothetical protein
MIGQRTRILCLFIYSFVICIFDSLLAYQYNEPRMTLSIYLQ